MPPTGDGPVKVSFGGGVQPRWKGDGRELYYLSLDGQLMAVDMECPPGRESNNGIPHPLFDTGIATPSMQIEDYAPTGPDPFRWTG